MLFAVVGGASATSKVANERRHWLVVLVRHLRDLRDLRDVRAPDLNILN